MKNLKSLPFLLIFFLASASLFAGVSKENQRNTQRESIKTESHSAPVEASWDDAALTAPENEITSLEDQVPVERLSENPRPAPEAFSSLSKSERKAFRKSLRKAFFKNLFSGKKRKRGKRSPQQADQIVCIIVSIFIPPLGVYLWEDDITINFWISLILMFLPPFGIIWAILVICGIL